MSISQAWMWMLCIVLIFLLLVGYSRNRRQIRHYQSLLQDAQRRAEQIELQSLSYEELMHLHSGMIFKIRRFNGKCIDTVCFGKLVPKLPDSIISFADLTRYVPESQRAETLAYFKSAWSGKEVEFENTLLDGHVYYTTLAPVLRDGKVTEVVGYTLDMTERRRMEETLQESEGRYHSLVEMSPEGIAVHADGVFQFVNSTGLKLLGAQRADEIIGRPVMDFVHPSSRTFIEERIHRSTVDRMPTQLGEFRMIRLDGVVIEAEVAGVPIQYNRQPATQIVIRDITERKRTEEWMRKSETLAVTGQLAASIAHEIRNPLTTLRGFLQLLQGQNGGRPEIYQIMLGEMEHINFIVGELLMLESPDNTLFEQKDVTKVIQNVIVLMSPQALLHNVTFSTSLACDSAQVYCEENQMKQVFINIIRNAIEAMPNGGVIRVGIREENHCVVISIRDSGCGIPEERLATLGEPFYTTKEKGTGLGLMVSFKIIQDHQGTISFESKPGEGTTVMISLPVKVTSSVN